MDAVFRGQDQPHTGRMNQSLIEIGYKAMTDREKKKKP